MYESINRAVLDRISGTARSLLDVGCGTGALGAAVKHRQACHITGITFDASEAAAAACRIDKVLVADLDSPNLPPTTPVQSIVCSHVLEHLKSPERLLRVLATRVADDANELVVALPNALFWRQRIEFFRGRFHYTDGGLMDRTHLRFYDVESARELLDGSGWRVIETFADGGLPGSRRLPTTLRVFSDRLASRHMPGLFGHQFVFRAVPRR